MKLLPRTLFGQLLLALFTGLFAAQAAGFWLMLDERERVGERLLGAYAAQRVAGVISVFDQAGPAERARLLHGLNVPPIHVSLSEPWQDVGAVGAVGADDADRFIMRVMKELEHPVPLQLLSIKRADLHRRSEGAGHGWSEALLRPASHEHTTGVPGRERRPVLFVTGQARLGDGAVLTFRHSVPQLGMDWPLRLLAMLALLGLSVAILAGWTVRKLTRPLAALADAATGLSQNLERPPLPESGPLEVARAARAFNAMQQGLKNYLETRAQALAAVSHDLRMPLTRLRLRLERVSDAELQAKMDDDLSEMDDMIGNTLEFLRAGSTAEKLQRLDINALLESITGDIAMMGAHLELSGTASSPLIARPLALRRCIANLMDNAMRYGGPDIVVSVVDQGKQIDIRIMDRGPGIPEAELERVFQPYVRIESSRARHTGGTGLGLAIARAIARSHSGDVRLAAREGGGLCAILYLPRTDKTEQDTRVSRPATTIDTLG